MNVSQETGGAGQPSAFRRPFFARYDSADGGLPIVRLDKGEWDLLALKGELVGGQLRHCRGLLEEEAVDAFQDAAHPIVELHIGKLIDQEVHSRLGMICLEQCDFSLLTHNAYAILGEQSLLGTDTDIDARQLKL